ncbi:MAG: hypothetical protein U5P10_00150 [Spirochaetia bacterium]|nr:hypothetical protein [Spirochaetia bacterium]
MKKLLIVLLLFVSLTLFANESVEEKIENKWGINYSNPEKYLMQTPNTEVSPEFREELKNSIGEVDGIKDLQKVYRFIHKNFPHYSDAGYEEDPVDYVGQINMSRLTELRVFSGCTTLAVILASILRELDTPAIHIQGPGIGWALNDITEYTSGHAMVEAYIEGQWVLLDSVNNHITVDYDPTDPVIAFNTTNQEPNPYEDVGYFIMFGGLLALLIVLRLIKRWMQSKKPV